MQVKLCILAGVVMLCPLHESDAQARNGSTVKTVMIYTEDQVETPVGASGTLAAPRYPEVLRCAGLEGRVSAVFVVDGSGKVKPGTIELSGTHGLFEQAVRAVLPGYRYTPALLRSRPVSQRVYQGFNFTLPAPESAEWKAIQKQCHERMNSFRDSAKAP